ncbi:MAG: insulinase family protein, partial [Pseudohongiellaceae bacterium]
MIKHILHKYRILALLLAVFAISSCSEAPDTSGSALSSAEQSGSVALPAGITLLESVPAKPDEIIIPYSKYQLDNGLTLIVHEDTSDPLIHVDVTYHVGSAREEPRRSGFAHFFEHMMFQGSEHVGDDEHFRIVTEAGGTMN